MIDPCDDFSFIEYLAQPWWRSLSLILRLPVQRVTQHQGVIATIFKDYISRWWILHLNSICSHCLLLLLFFFTVLLIYFVLLEVTVMLLLGSLVHLLDLLDQHPQPHLVILRPLHVAVVNQSLAELPSNVHQHGYGEVAIFVRAFSGSAEGGLEGKGINYLMLLPEDDSCCRFFGLIDSEGRTLIAKLLASPAKQKRKDSLFEFSLFLIVITAVHEGVLSPGMSMKIAIENDVPRLKCLPNHHFDSLNFGKQANTWSNPLAIQVTSRETASIVTNNNSIWIEHRYDLENISLPQGLGSLTLT